jgi:hypothetical protein
MQNSEKNDKKSKMNREDLLRVEIYISTEEHSRKTQISDELNALDVGLLEQKGIKIDSAKADYNYADLDDDGGSVLTEFVIGVASGILTTYTAQGLLYLIKLFIEKLVNKVSRSERTRLILKTKNAEYNVLRTEERMKFKAVVDKVITDKNREAINNEFEEIRKLIINRFDQAE